MSQNAWLDADSPRVGLGCMRLTDAGIGERVAIDTIAAAVESGITVFDTAHSYGPSADAAGDKERVLARALRACGGAGRARVVTKGGMTRHRAAWIADGRASSLQSQCQASLSALDGLPIDLYLVHAPDPRTPWRTTVRALAKLLDAGMVRHVGVANVSRVQLDQARDIVAISAVEVPLSPFSDRAFRDGLVDDCASNGMTVLAHAPLGGPARVARLSRDPVLVQIAARHCVGPAEIALAWLLDVSSVIIPIPGARRPETARSVAHAAAVRLSAEERHLLRTSLGYARPARRDVMRAHGDSEVVLIAGVPGAGKSRMATRYVSDGYRRLNRDERGGSIRALTQALDDLMRSGTKHVVMDNTWGSRAARADALQVAHAHGAS
ncbi:MAG: aldo/keto reductase, partial [Candidatus Dormibacteria bacterium]